MKTVKDSDVLKFLGLPCDKCMRKVLNTQLLSCKELRNALIKSGINVSDNKRYILQNFTIVIKQ